MMVTVAPCSASMLARTQAAVVLPAPPLGDENVMTGIDTSLEAVWLREAAGQPSGAGKLSESYPVSESCQLNGKHHVNLAAPCSAPESCRAAIGFRKAVRDLADV
jgi:hypothetical protein